MFHCGYPLKETEKLEGKKSSPLETRWKEHILAPILLAGHGTTFVCEKTCHFSTRKHQIRETSTRKTPKFYQMWKICEKA